MALIAFYIYADFLSLYRPGLIDEVRGGVGSARGVSGHTVGGVIDSDDSGEHDCPELGPSRRSEQVA